MITPKSGAFFNPRRWSLLTKRGPDACSAPISRNAKLNNRTKMYIQLAKDELALALDQNTDEAANRARKEAIFILVEGTSDPMTDKQELRAVIELILDPPPPRGMGVLPT